MDVTTSSRRLSYGLLPIALLSLAAGCFAPPTHTIPPPSQERFSKISQSVALLRRLERKRDFEIGAIDSARFDPTPIPDDAPLERAYKQLGLLGASDDFKTELGKYRRLERLIGYDNNNDRLLIAADAHRLASELQPPYQRATTELPLALGIVQALQEQHFQWQDKISRTGVDDTRLAYRAVAGGDALLTALAHGSDGNLASPGHLTAARQVGLQIARLARDLAPFLSSQLSFPFREGSDFVAWAVKAKGTDGLNSLYANPPGSTAQILHPEKYFLARQIPQRFLPAQLLRRMAAPVLVDQTIGEFLLRGLLESEHSIALARQIAAGWRGDQLFSFDGKSVQTTAWYSAWGSAAEAAAFQHGFQAVVEKRQRTRLRPGRGKDNATLSANTRDRGSIALTRKNNLVLYLVTGADRLFSLTEEAWKDLVVETQPQPFGFESARGPAQLSLRKR